MSKKEIRRRFEILRPDHLISTFSSTEPEIEDFLRNHAIQGDSGGWGTTRVLVEDPQMPVLAFYTLCSTSVKRGSVPVDPKDPPYPVVPGLLLGRMGVDSAYTGQRLGELTLMHAMVTADQCRAFVGWRFLVVDAKHDGLIGFYRKYGFTQIGAHRRLYMSQAQVAEAARLAVSSFALGGEAGAPG